MHFMQSQDLLLCSQQPTSSPYCKPDKASPHPPILFPDPVQYYPSMYSKQPSSDQKLVQIYFLPHPQHATFYTPLILLEVITQTKYNEVYIYTGFPTSAVQ
jgi:hypothetical protein